MHMKIIRAADIVAIEPVHRGAGQFGWDVTLKKKGGSTAQVQVGDWRGERLLGKYAAYQAEQKHPTKKGMGVFRKIGLCTLMVCGLAVGESAIAQNIDSSKVEKPEIQLSLKKMPVKPYLNLKGFGTLYDGGKTTGVGLGMETGLSVGKYTVGSTGSIVNQGDKVKLEEASVFVVVPLGKTTVVGYSYMDRFLRQTVPAYGLNVKGFGVKVGAEISPYKDADGCWVGYVKVPVGSVVLGAGLAGWNDAGGLNGGIKKYVLTLNTSHELGKGVTLSTELLYGKLVEVGTPGYLNFRMTVTKGF